MSLIDEALKRAEMEAARRDGLKGGAYPWMLEQQGKRGAPWGVIGAVVLIAGGLAAGWMWWSSRPGTGPVQGPTSKVQSSAPTQELPTVEVAPPPRGFPSRVVASDGETASSRAGAEAKKAAPKPATEAPRVRSASDAVARPGAAPAESKSARAAAEPKSYVGEVTVPDGGKIELGGIVFSESNPVALINGKVLGPGAVIEEFTIVSIQPDRVELRGRGTTLFLSLK